jgi:hypothetical protein
MNPSDMGVCILLGDSSQNDLSRSHHLHPLPFALHAEVEDFSFAWEPAEAVQALCDERAEGA